MPHLELSLIGRFEAVLDGKPISTFKSSKVRALLAYLAAEANQPHRREDIAALIWPDWPAQSALSNLRYALVDLRNNIADRQAQPPFLLITRDAIQLNLESDLRVDIVAFERSLAGSDQLSTLEPLQTAVDLYQGAFMAGFSLPDSAPFEEWLTVRREVLKRQVLQALHSLAEYHQQKAEFQKALPYAYRQVEIEPWLEEAHQQVMRLLALSGQRSAALAQYETCRQSLKDGLNVEPGAETVQLYEAIRDGSFAITIPEKDSKELAPAPGIPPFKGLQYFDTFDAALFFGREALIRQLSARLKEEGFLAIVGASGSGKSSLARAGLVPVWLRDHDLPSDWPSRAVHVITPTAHPLESLAASLTRDSESVTATSTLMDDLAKDPRSLNLYVRKLLSLSGNARLLLVVDQFEEMFTTCKDTNERKAFIDNLLTAVSTENAGALRIVLTLRADFYHHCAEYEGLRQAFEQHQAYIGAMTPEELRHAIEAPAMANGWEFQPGLVNLILQDVGEEPGALPLLSHALLETWRRRQGHTLTLDGYTAAGGVRKAIAFSAESFYNHLDPAEQILARGIFLRLTELGEGEQDTRRRARLDELAPAPDQQVITNIVLKRLADARLITLAEGSAEVAHEALIREWPALRNWLSEDREGLRLHHRLTEAAQAWAEMAHDPGELYRGARLAQAQEWAVMTGHAQELNMLEQEFLTTSQALAEHETAEREAQRQRELETAQKLAETEQHRAEEQTHSAQRLRQRAVYLAGALAIAILMVVAAAYFGWSANRQAAEATTRQFAFAALANLAVDPGQSIAQALQSIQIKPSVEAYNALHQALFTNHMRSRLIAQQGEVYGLAINPAGDRLATIGTDQVLNVWRLNGAAIVQPPLLTINKIGLDKNLLAKYPVFPEALVFSPDGQFLATIDNDGLVILLDAQTGKLVQKYNSNGSGSTGFGDAAYTFTSNPAFSPDGKLITVILHAMNQLIDNGIVIWDVKNGQMVAQFWGGDTNNQTFNTFAFAPDGKQLATGGWDNNKNAMVKFWNLEKLTSYSLAVIPGTLQALGEFGVNSMRFSPDGRHLAFTTPNAAHIQDLTPLSSGAPALETLKIPLENQFVAAYYLPASNWLVTAYQGGRINIWNAGSSQLLFKLLPELPVTAAAASSDGRVFFTAHPNGEVRAWDVSSPGSAEWLEVPTGGVRGSVVLSADGARLLGRNLSDAAQGQWDFSWWQVADSQVSSLGGYTIKTGNLSSDLIFNPDLSRIALIDQVYGTARVIDSANGELIKQLELGPGVNEVLFNVDGTQLLVSRSYGFVDAWDVAAARQLYSFKIADVPDVKGQSFYEVLSKDGTLLLTWGSNDPLIRLWKADTGQFIKEFGGSSGALCRPVITPDSLWLLTCGEDQTVLVWDVAAGKLARTIKLPDRPNLVQVTPDMRYIVAGLVSSQTAVYDFKSGRQTARLPGSSSMGVSAGADYQFSPDGKYIWMTIPGDQTAYGFALDNNQLVALACEHLAAISLPVSQGGNAQLPICKTGAGKP